MSNPEVIQNFVAEFNSRVLKKYSLDKTQRDPVTQDDLKKMSLFMKFYDPQEMMTLFKSGFYLPDAMPFELALKLSDANAHAHEKANGIVDVIDCLPATQLPKKEESALKKAPNLFKLYMSAKIAKFGKMT